MAYLFGGIFAGFFTAMPFQRTVVDDGAAALVWVVVLFGLLPWLPRVFIPVSKVMQQNRDNRVLGRRRSLGELSTDAKPKEKLRAKPFHRTLTSIIKKKRKEKSNNVDPQDSNNIS